MKKEKIKAMKTKGKNFYNIFDIYFEDYCSLCKEDLHGIEIEEHTCKTWTKIGIDTSKYLPNKKEECFNVYEQADEIVGEQYEIREIVIINFIEWYASEEKDREPLRKAMNEYLQEELWVDFEGMKLKEGE